MDEEEKVQCKATDATRETGWLKASGREYTRPQTYNIKHRPTKVEEWARQEEDYNDQRIDSPVSAKEPPPTLVHIFDERMTSRSSAVG